MSHFDNFIDLSKREFSILFTLVFFTVLFGIYPNFILDGIHMGVSTLMYNFDYLHSLTYTGSSFQLDNLSVDKLNFQGLNFKFTRGISTLTRRTNIQVRNYYSEVSSNSNIKVAESEDLHPEYVVGLTDAEGSFMALVRKEPKLSVGWRTSCCFQIGLASWDKPLLDKLQSTFKVGTINKAGNNAYLYRVTSPKDLLDVIIPFFDKYPLLTQKKSDFLLFKQIVEAINNKEHSAVSMVIFIQDILEGFRPFILR